MGSRPETGRREAFQDLLLRGAAALGLELDREAVAALALYHRELQRWSGKVNLIARNTPEAQVVESHFLDSLTLLPLLPPAARLLDIGTGAGFPGLACKAVRPDLLLTLVEPRLKRVSFLRHIVRTLGMNEVTIVADRIEDERQLPATTPFTHVTSRAVADIAGFLTMAGRFSQPGLKLVCMKGPKWREELAAAGPVIATLAFALEEVIETTLPFSGAMRALLVFAATGDAILAKPAAFC
ncbi:MAG: 16S rRNA (guanine(527)-N(7))-methyltransferase RsmG [Desulfoprunum sp.]|uniref:16S rRNA (guanine(527)-N(7))-methyltransferase RsmG n=1 Tax=Desulfoprunum sp. TaxID=2020866 RepID=UPI003C71442E